MTDPAPSAARFLNDFPFEVTPDRIASPAAPGGAALAAPAGGGGSAGGTGVLASLNKSVQNKSALNKNKAGFDSVGRAGSGMVPALELRRLHQIPAPDPFTVATRFVWECLDIALPPGPDFTRLETAVLLAMQARDGERTRRLPEIEAQAALSVDEFLRPLGIEELAGFEATEGLFLNILAMCEYVGLLYKARIDRDRPNVAEPRLRPLLPVPAHESFPSNHAFQSFSIVLAFNTIVPGHPATEELSRLAQNVAENREWAGLHYPSDTEAGKELARRFAPYLRDAFAAAFLAAQAEWQ